MIVIQVEPSQNWRDESSTVFIERVKKAFLEAGLNHMPENTIEYNNPETMMLHFIIKDLK